MPTRSRVSGAFSKNRSQRSYRAAGRRSNRCRVKGTVIQRIASSSSLNSSCWRRGRGCNSSSTAASSGSVTCAGAPALSGTMQAARLRRNRCWPELSTGCRTGLSISEPPAALQRRDPIIALSVRYGEVTKANVTPVTSSATALCCRKSSISNWSRPCPLCESAPRRTGKSSGQRERQHGQGQIQEGIGQAQDAGQAQGAEDKEACREEVCEGQETDRAQACHPAGASPAGQEPPLGRPHAFGAASTAQGRPAVAEHLRTRSRQDSGELRTA